MRKHIVQFDFGHLYTTYFFFALFARSFVHSSLFLSAVAIFPCSGCISEYECNIFVRELIFNGSAGSIRAMCCLLLLLDLMTPFIDAVWLSTAQNK